MTGRAFAALATLAITVAGAPAARAARDDMSLGPANARVTVIEYASTTCPHCARWDKEVFPAFRKAYVDTGKVRYVLREWPTPPEELAVAGFLLARCASGKYFEVLDALWRDQGRLYDDQDALGWLENAGERAGLDKTRVRACVEDEGSLKAFNAREDENRKALKVTGTPTVFVNGKEIGQGEIPYDQLARAIDSALKSAAHQPARPHGRKKR